MFQLRDRRLRLWLNHHQQMGACPHPHCRRRQSALFLSIEALPCAVPGPHSYCQSAQKSHLMDRTVLRLLVGGDVPALKQADLSNENPPVINTFPFCRSVEVWAYRRSVIDEVSANDPETGSESSAKSLPAVQ